jgi:serine/threonine-protein kinase RsbW
MTNKTMEQQLSFSSKSENLNLVEKLIDDVCTKNNVNEDYYGNILIAITEAVNNAIHHGNKSNPEKSVNVQYNSQGDKLLFTIQDEGPGFDYDNLPDPTDPQNIEKPHGRGVFLMKNLADKIDFFDGGSTVKIEFNVSKKPE